MRWHGNIRLVLSRLTAVALCLAVLFASSEPALARGYEGASEAKLRRMGIYFTSLDDPCLGSMSDVTMGGAAKNLKEAQAKNAQTIIGIARSLNLHPQAALIALMVALAESHLQMYASSVVPISQQNPAWLELAVPRPIGKDYDSVGVFQQRVSQGWSTFGNGTSKDIVWQLMDPAYGAQAFLGTPKGATVPSGLKNPQAIQHGLINKVPNYMSQDPWVVAQKVQISAFDGNPRPANNFSSVYGGNYKDQLKTAQDLMQKYAPDWNTVERVPLPIALNAPDSTGPTTVSGPEDCSGDLGDGAGDVASLQKIIYAYAWHEYHKAPYKVMTKDYARAVKNAKGPPIDYSGGGMYPGIDCGGFVTRALRDSGWDPEFNKSTANVRGNRDYMNAHPEKYEKLTNIKSTSQLRHGDVWVNSDASHTYVFAGEDMPKDFKGNAASASYGGNNPNGSWRTPMAENAYDLGETWYRVKK